MATVQTISERQEAGKLARERSPRSHNAMIGHVDRDPVQLLRENSAGRVEALVPLRYGRMSISPFTFYRGSAILQAHDLSGTSYSGITFPVCGDAHLMNFGGFATPERQLIFDLNDFDEVAVGPWEWDVKRLAASFAIAGDHMGIERGSVKDIVATAMQESGSDAQILRMQRSRTLARNRHVRANDRRCRYQRRTPVDPPDYGKSGGPHA